MNPWTRRMVRKYRRLSIDQQRAFMLVLDAFLVLRAAR